MSQPSRKRLREKPTVDAARSAIFEDLAHENEDIRIKAASRLLERLRASDGEDEFKYSLNRLFGGLCSSRKAARLGFSVALTEVLTQHGPGDPAAVLRLWLETTETAGQMDGQETRDYVLGRVFAAAAITQSGILFRDRSDQTHWKQLLQSLIVLAKKRPWAREQCGWVCYIALQKLPALGLDAGWPSALLTAFCEQALGKTSECVALWITAQRLYPALVVPPNIFPNNDPLSEKSWKSLVDILKETPHESDEDAKHSQRGAWSAQPHFAWRVVFDALSDDRFRILWQQMIDEGLFAASSSPERKHWGLSLFSIQVATAVLPRLPCLFTRNLCRCLLNQIPSKGRYLHTAANKAAEAIICRAESDAAAASAILLRLLEDDLKTTFSAALLRGKVMDKLVAFIEISTLVSLAKRSISPSLKLDQLDLALAAVRSRPYPKPGSTELTEIRKCCSSIIDSLVERAYFDFEDPDSKSREQVDSRLQSLLTTLSVKEQAPTFYPYAAVSSLGKFERQLSKSPLTGSSATAAVKMARTAIKKLHASGEDGAAGQKGALEILLSTAVLQLYSGESDALEILEDLRHCFEDVESDELENRGRAAEAMVDVVLSFVSKTPKLWKNLAQQAFSLFVEVATEDAVESMIAVLDTKESVAGRNEMFGNADEQDVEEEEDVDEDDEEGADGAESRGESVDADEDGEEDEDDDEDMDSDDELDSDVEMVEADDADSGSDEEDEEDEGSGEDGQELSEFDAKLAQALGTRRADADLAHEDDESSESDMDDEQMEALDEHLSLMFKQRKQTEDTSKEKKREKKDAKETITVFKTRVLDLLKVLIDRQPHKPLALDLLLPLLRLVQSTQNKPLAKKAADLIHSFFKNVKLVKKGPVKSAEATALEKKSKKLLKEVHQLALQQGSNQFHASCSQGSLLLAKVHLANGGRVGDIETRYEKTKKANEGGKTLKESFFTEWTHWYASSKQHLSV